MLDRPFTASVPILPEVLPEAARIDGFQPLSQSLISRSVLVCMARWLDGESLFGKGGRRLRDVDRGPRQVAGRASNSWLNITRLKTRSSKSDLRDQAYEC